VKLTVVVYVLFARAPAKIGDVIVAWIPVQMSALQSVIPFRAKSLKNQMVDLKLISTAKANVKMTAFVGPWLQQRSTADPTNIPKLGDFIFWGTRDCHKR